MEQISSTIHLDKRLIMIILWKIRIACTHFSWDNICILKNVKEKTSRLNLWMILNNLNNQKMFDLDKLSKSANNIKYKYNFIMHSEKSFSKVLKMIIMNNNQLKSHLMREKMDSVEIWNIRKRALKLIALFMIITYISFDKIRTQKVLFFRS